MTNARALKWLKPFKTLSQATAPCHKNVSGGTRIALEVVWVCPSVARRHKRPPSSMLSKKCWRFDRATKNNPDCGMLTYLMYGVSTPLPSGNLGPWCKTWRLLKAAFMTQQTFICSLLPRLVTCFLLVFGISSVIVEESQGFNISLSAFLAFQRGYIYPLESISNRLLNWEHYPLKKHFVGLWSDALIGPEKVTAPTLSFQDWSVWLGRKKRWCERRMRAAQWKGEGLPY